MYDQQQAQVGPASRNKYLQFGPRCTSGEATTEVSHPNHRTIGRFLLFVVLEGVVELAHQHAMTAQNHCFRQGPPDAGQEKSRSRNLDGSEASDRHQASDRTVSPAVAAVVGG